MHKLIADVALFAGERVLFVRYRDVSRYDGQRGWFLPDDFIRYGEHPEDAAKRIAKEQMELDLPEVRLSHIESFANGAWHLTFHYRSDLKRVPGIVATGNVAEAEWFDIESLPNRSAVAHHGWALDVVKEMSSRKRSVPPRTQSASRDVGQGPPPR